MLYYWWLAVLCFLAISTVGFVTREWHVVAAAWGEVRVHLPFPLLLRE